MRQKESAQKTTPRTYHLRLGCISRNCIVNQTLILTIHFAFTSTIVKEYR
jgi:hypothetical protein